MPAAAPSALGPLVRKLSRRASVQRVLLFGSRARGDNAPRSDIDIAVEAESADEREWDWIAETVDNAETLLLIDLVRLDEASGPLRERIEREGVVLFDRDQGPPLAAPTRTRAHPPG